MEDRDLVELVSAINHISLNQEDLMGALLDFNRIFTQKDDEKIALLNKFMENDEFVYQSMVSAREAIVLAINALMLKDEIDFDFLVGECVAIDAQRVAEDSVCADEETKKIMREFMSSLRKELFSRVFSQNKGFNKISGLSKNIIKNRFDIFMNREF